MPAVSAQEGLSPPGTPMWPWATYERYSMPFFLGGAPDYGVAVLSECLSEGESPKYSPATVEKHVAECFMRSHAPVAA